MISCKCSWQFGGCLLVTFPNHPGKSVLIQTTTDLLAFIDNCELLPPGHPATPSERLSAFAPDDVERCPAEYLDVATNDPNPFVGGLVKAING